MLDSHSDKIKKAYSNRTVAKKYYEEFFAKDIFLSERENFIEEFMSELPSSGLILDLGCGNGQHSIFIARNKPDCNIVGVDFSCSMLKFAKREKRKARVYNLNFICNNFLSYLNILQSPRHRGIGCL